MCPNIVSYSVCKTLLNDDGYVFFVT